MQQLITVLLVPRQLGCRCCLAHKLNMHTDSLMVPSHGRSWSAGSKECCWGATYCLPPCPHPSSPRQCEAGLCYPALWTPLRSDSLRSDAASQPNHLCSGLLCVAFSEQRGGDQLKAQRLWAVQQQRLALGSAGKATAVLAVVCASGEWYLYGNSVQYEVVRNMKFQRQLLLQLWSRHTAHTTDCLRPTEWGAHTHWTTSRTQELNQTAATHYTYSANTTDKHEEKQDTTHWARPTASEDPYGTKQVPGRQGINQPCGCSQISGTNTLPGA